MTERYKGQERFIHEKVLIEAGRDIIPAAEGDERVSITLTPFLDHGRPAFVASTIKSRKALVEAASHLSSEDSLRITNTEGRVLEGALDNAPIKSSAVLSSTKEGKPDIHMIIFGDPFNPSSLRLYYHLGTHKGAPVLFRDARTRTLDADKVERVFKQGGYNPPKNWQGNRGRN